MIPMAMSLVEQEVNPITLADLMLVTPLRRRANLVVLAPNGDQYRLVAKRGSSTLATLDVSSDAGNAAVARLARMAEIDPFGRVAPGQPRAARLRVRVGPDIGELLITIETSPQGLEAELRPITVNGQALEQAQRGQLKRCVRCAAFQAPQRERCELDGGELIDVADDPQPGGTIGVYRIGRVLGDGGMATVVAGQHALIGRPVAVKVPHLNMVENPQLVRRFLAEARAASRLHHPNIIDVTDYGIMSDGRPYMVMELLSGVPLRNRLEQRGAMPPLPALLLTREVTLALTAAHDAGVVHRDLKPDNIMLLDNHTDEIPRLKLMDFGAAALLDEIITDETVIVGTPWYMAPEHSRGEATDGRTDIYALGVVLYEMLTGSVPFDGETNTEVRLAHIVEPVPTAISPGELLPSAVTRIVERALRKHPEERYQSAAEMTGDLDKAITALRRRDWRRWLPV
jgi:hypothetical protein